MSLGIPAARLLLGLPVGGPTYQVNKQVWLSMSWAELQLPPLKWGTRLAQSRTASGIPGHPLNRYLHACPGALRPLNHRIPYTGIKAVPLSPHPSVTTAPLSAQPFSRLGVLAPVPIAPPHTDD
jgi:hypothetical protein